MFLMPYLAYAKPLSSFFWGGNAKSFGFYLCLAVMLWATSCSITPLDKISSQQQSSLASPNGRVAVDIAEWRSPPRYSAQRHSLANALQRYLFQHPRFFGAGHKKKAQIRLGIHLKVWHNPQREGQGRAAFARLGLSVRKVKKENRPFVVKDKEVRYLIPMTGSYEKLSASRVDVLLAQGLAEGIGRIISLHCQDSRCDTGQK